MPDAVRDTITPASWGVDRDCFVTLTDPQTSERLVEQVVRAGDLLNAVIPVSDTIARLELVFRRVTSAGRPGGVIGTAHQWVPPSRRGVPPGDVRTVGTGLQVSRRSDVTLAPGLRSVMVGKGIGATRGYIGAWAGGQAVVEAMDFVLGRPYYTFLPPIEAIRKLSGTAIYLSSPMGGWGHFLTQGLARIWYALEHPELPVIWDSPRLTSFQERIVDLLGLQNEQHFLTEPTRWDEVVFPYPGCCIGDFVLPAWTEAVGRLPLSAQQPGKRLLLSRSALPDTGTPLELELDRLAAAQGYAVYHPEQHDVVDQVAEISSAETVLAVEGSALHTVLLMQSPVATRFWALTRHRGGGGVFEHIRQSKGLRYETLDFTTTGRRGKHRSPLDLDVAAFERALDETDGLTRNLEALEGRLERPAPEQTPFATQLEYLPVRHLPPAGVLSEIHVALLRHDRRAAMATIAAHL